MATVSTFRPCTYSSEADFDAIANLINTCREADDIDIRISITDVREDYANPRFDITRDLQLWRDGNGELVAIAEFWHSPQPEQTEVLGSFYFDVHPHVRGDGLEDSAMAWAEQRLRETGQDLSLPLVLHTGCRDKLTEHRKLLARFGFTPERYFFQLKRSLQEEILELPVPAGWKVRTVDAKSDAEVWVEMFNQSFVDHWNHTPMTVEEFHYYSSFSDHNPDLDLVLETPEGNLVTFCYSSIDTERNERLGQKEGHVCLLGTRRGYRRQGLARALLTEGLKLLKTMGMETATIGVDGQNPSGAVALYKSVGFTEDFRSTVYRKEVT
ncbi:MAG: GNAT family N-acetyltransferase [Leptolyngbya sp. SIO3F4]|nr:GNAT family N-acetyltransferase [Leptolyngbya sp. SIO3F4]